MDKKYITCLKLVEHIVNRELGTVLDSKYYHNLGRVSCFIDTSLDSLTLVQKAVLLESFDDLFDELSAFDNLENFNRHVINYIKENELGLACSLPELRALHSFVLFQKKHQLLDQLKSFGKQIISISIRQQLAVSSDELITLLKQEGEQVIQLLRSNLILFTAKHKKLENTIRLLTYFEQILNLGDDFLDVRKDIHNERIRVKSSIQHRFRLLMMLIVQISKTFFKNPLKCLYYYPKCSFFYLIHQDRIAL